MTFILKKLHEAGSGSIFFCQRLDPDPGFSRQSEPFFLEGRIRIRSATQCFVSVCISQPVYILFNVHTIRRKIALSKIPKRLSKRFYFFDIPKCKSWRHNSKQEAILRIAFKKWNIYFLKMWKLCRIIISDIKPLKVLIINITCALIILLGNIPFKDIRVEPNEKIGVYFFMFLFWETQIRKLGTNVFDP